MKKESNLKRLLDYAGGYKYLTIASWILSAISALVALLPFVYIWKVIREILDVSPNYGDAQNLTHNGWMAVLSAVAAILIYVAALICSHLAAFRVQANVRMKAMHHIVTLPMGFMDSMGSGKARKTVYESSAATETYLAHQLPDKARAVASGACKPSACCGGIYHYECHDRQTHGKENGGIQQCPGTDGGRGSGVCEGNIGG